jgi:hypothetical protein
MLIGRQGTKDIPDSRRKNHAEVLFTTGNNLSFYQAGHADSVDIAWEYRLRNFFAKFS